jgi:hypothetical protein
VGVIASVLADYQRLPVGHPCRPLLDEPLAAWLANGPFEEAVVRPREFHLQRRLDNGTLETWVVAAACAAANGRVTLTGWRQRDTKGGGK